MALAGVGSVGPMSAGDAATGSVVIGAGASPVWVGNSLAAEVASSDDSAVAITFSSVIISPIEIHQSNEAVLAMLEDFLTDELTLAITIGGEPNPLRCAQCVTNGFELGGFVSALRRASAVKIFGPQQDRRPTLPGRHNILRLEEIEQMSLGREDRSVARTHGSTDVFGLAGFLCDDDLISHDSSFRRIDEPLEHTANKMVSQAAPIGAASGRILERGEAAPFRSAREMGAAVTQTPWRFRCHLGRDIARGLEGTIASGGIGPIGRADWMKFKNLEAPAAARVWEW